MAKQQSTPNQVKNPYKFSVYRNAAWTTAAGVNAPVPFDTVSFDNSNGFSIGTGKYTVPVSGFYQINARMSTGNNSRSFVAIYKNASIEIGRGSDYAHDASAGTSSNISKIVQLSAGDTVYLNYYTATGFGIETGPNSAYFEGFLVSAA